MSYFLRFFFAVLCWQLFSFPASAQIGQNEPGLTTQVTTFVDSSGAKWKRWVMTEKEDNGTVLLVVENPVRFEKDTSVSQRIVVRKNFSPGREKALAAAVKYYFSLSDRKNKELAESMGRSFPRTEEVFGQNVEPSPLWIAVKNNWTLDDEKDYANWIENTVKPEFLVGTGLINDCAKFAVALRWIYARDHKLPVANTIMGSQKLIGQWSGSLEWDQLPSDPDWRKDKRFITALKYVMNSIYTHSIYGDLYPITLTKDFVTPGAIILILYSAATGHTQVIDGVGNDADKAMCGGRSCITVIYGNEPAAETGYKSVAWIVNGGLKEGGFMRWRWPIFVDGAWTLTAKTDMPGYGLDQYTKPKASETGFTTWIYEQVGIRSTYVDQALLLVASLKSLLFERARVSATGYLVCSLVPCDVTSELYDSYSTPNGDKRIREIKQNLFELLSKVAPGDADITEAKNEMTDEIVGGSGLSYADFIFNTGGASDTMSPDPTQSIFKRWSINNLDPTTDINVLLWAFKKAWAERDDQVEQAVSLCFAAGPTKLTCDPKSAAVEALATTRLDQGLRLLRSNIQGVYKQLEPGAAAKVAGEAKTVVVYPFNGECNWNKEINGHCTTFDFILSDHDMIEKMSSDPTAIYHYRYGFPQTAGAKP